MTVEATEPDPTAIPLVNRSDRVCRIMFIIIAATLSAGLMESLGLTEVVWDGATGGTSGHRK
jgi:hypothetical protein